MITIDSNILIYAVDNTQGRKHDIAIEIVERAMTTDLVITAQVIGEYLAVVHRKMPPLLPTAIDQAKQLAILCPPVPTTIDHLAAGALMAATHRLQFWDSVIWQVAASREVRWFLSEDMQDGFSHSGMAALNPLNPANRDIVEAMFAHKA